MIKTDLEIVIPIYNEGENVVKLLKLFESLVKTKFRVLLCYDSDDDNIFNYKDEIKKLFDLLEGKDMQITSLTHQNESLSQQLDRLSQLLLISHKSIQDLTSQNQLLIETTQQKKPSFWQRLIGQKI